MADRKNRASMREGPLAALFRRTEEGDQPDTGQEPAQPGAPERGGPLSSAPQNPEASDPDRTQIGERPDVDATRAAERPAAPDPDVTRAAERPAAPDPDVTRTADRPEPSTPAARPHPSLTNPTPPAPEPEIHIPTPQERLRHAFSADIPESIMERPSRSAPAAPSAPPVDVYARPDTGPPPRAAQVGAPTLRVVGVGGAGVNAVNRMVEAEVEGVEFLAVNTDLQSLQSSSAHITLHIGEGVTRGLGAGASPDLGRQAAMEEYDKIKALLKGSDMIFITAGAGGGTGTGAAPIVARIAKEIGALTVGIVTKPFGFEGSRRREQADAGVEALAAEVDTLIVVPNNRLLSVLERNTSMVDAFRVADDVLRQGVQGISDLVTLPGLINLDFADVRTIMSEAGAALLGIGMGTGERRAIDAAEQAVASPLLETSMDGARSILLSITGGRDLSLWEVNEAAKAVSEAAHPEANIIFGAMVDEKLDDQVWVTVVATGYGNGSSRPPRRELTEPAGEPRVSRAGGPPERSRRSSLVDLDVPEFIPRG